MRNIAGRTLALTALLAFATNAHHLQAQQTPRHMRPSDLFKSCGGQLIEFVLPETRLYVDLHWLGSTTIIDLFDWVSGATCPTWPVEMTSIELGIGAVDLMDIRSGLGRKLLRLNVGGAPSGNVSSSGASKKANATGRPDKVWMEMKVYPDRTLSQTREYILHYSDPAGVPVGDVVVNCNGDVGKRQCGTYGADSYADLYIAYYVSQTELPIPNEMSTDPTTEPGAILQFETKLRELLSKMEQPPSHR